MSWGFHLCCFYKADKVSAHHQHANEAAFAIDQIIIAEGEPDSVCNTLYEAHYSLWAALDIAKLEDERCRA